MFINLFSIIAFNKRCIWYVQSSSGGAETKEGAAVAVKLRKKKEKGNWKLHLLTCAHVVRSGKGKVQDEIHVWKTGQHYKQAPGIKAKVSDEIQPPSNLTSNSLSNTSKAIDWIEHDWVILSLDIKDHSTEVIKQWDEAITYTTVDIYGFPEGKESFESQVVTATRSKDIFVDRVGNSESRPNCIDLTSDGTRPGMSGGGVFNYKASTLVGLHRSRNEATMELRAIPMAHIADVIDQLGYELLAQEDKTVFLSIVSLASIFVFILLLVWFT